MNGRIFVFWYHGQLAYATEDEYLMKADYMYCVLPYEYQTFEEAYDYLTTICNYDNYIVDMTEETRDDA